MYADSLGVELANLARDYAKEQGYSFVGPVRMRFEGVNDLTTGTFRIRSGVIRGSTVEGGEIRQPASDLPQPRGGDFGGRPRLIVSTDDPNGGGRQQRTYDLVTATTLLGRGTDCDLRLVDPGVSRHHAELRVEEGEVVLVDLGSTNGTFVNGQPIKHVVLTDGTQVTLGRTTLVFRRRSCTLLTASGRNESHWDMTDEPLTLTLIRLAFLAVLWLFVIAAIGVVRTDLLRQFGRPVAGRPAAGRRAAAAAPAERQAAETSRGQPHRCVVTGGALAGTTIDLSGAANYASAGQMTPRSS